MALKKQQKNSVRIIAGQWRGRKIDFADAEGLRPTPDRVRETLFNWLQASIPDSVCIDCFAGSGALGFEAASRGAKKVTLIEFNPAVEKYLKKNKENICAENVEIISDSAVNWLHKDPTSADIVLLDPPFASDLLQASLDVIVDKNIINAGGVIYLEYHEKLKPLIPQGWRWRRQKKSGGVGYGLLERDSNNN